MNDFRFPTASEALPALAGAVLTQGEEVGSRNGRTLEISHAHITLTEPWRREIVTPGRRASLPAQIAETMWVLAGRNDVAWLARYLPRATEFSDDDETWRGGYGPRIRNFGDALGMGDAGGQKYGVDQLKNVVELLKADPLSRRAVINIYDPTVDTAPGKDVPCNNWLHFMSRLGKLDLHVATRSNDLIWGWSGINAFEWSALQEIVAGLLGLQVGELHFSISSLHVYDRHWKRAQDLSEQQTEHWGALAPSPRFDASIAGGLTTVSALDVLVREWFEVEEMIRERRAGWRDSVEAFPEPMLRSWLRVISWWWHDDATLLRPLAGTPLFAAAVVSPRGARTGDAPTRPSAPRNERRAFTEFAAKLHADKHAVYGDSWKRRGELLAILANIARKVDRLGVAGGGDTSADTAVDLLIYLVKYRLWLTENAGAPRVVEQGEGHVWQVATVLRSLEGQPPLGENEYLIAGLKEFFDRLQEGAERGWANRVNVVDAMIPMAYELAHRLWVAEQPQSEGAAIDAWQARRPVPEKAYGNPYRFVEDGTA